MALAQALMASLLVDGPCSGYDLVKRFDEHINFYWAASHQQVYKTLKEMEISGWVSSEAIAQTHRPNKRVYQLTPAGKEQLAHWAAQPSEPTSVREDLMVKIQVGFLLPRPTILEELKRRQHLHQENLLLLKRVEAQDFPDRQTLSTEEKFCYLCLRRGIRFESDWVDWCEEAIALIEN